MRMTKLGHSCVRLEKGGSSIVLDPGVWSGADPIAGAAAVLITHEHADHFDPPVVRAALERDPALELWTTAPVAAQLADFADRVHVVGHGDSFGAAGFDIGVHGRDHAQIHPDLPVVPNVGFTVDGDLFHPGDAFTIPQQQVQALLLPISAPWLKTSEMIDYARAVRPKMSYAVHDELLSDKGLRLIEQLASGLLGGASGSYQRLAPGSGVDL